MRPGAGKKGGHGPPRRTRKPATAGRSRVGPARRSGRTVAEKPDALAFLARDHRRVADLLGQVPEDPAVLHQAQHELEVHDQLEEELLYPALEQILGEEGAELVEDLRLSHAHVKVRLIELSILGGGQEFERKLAELRERLERHLEEEEKSLFARARRALPGARLQELRVRIELRQDELTGGLYPG
jgi:iron-sulfur cluster repair protein YtfE (RIC family)